jgi:hypothetical protein
MIIRQLVTCPHCGASYRSEIEFFQDQTDAQEQCLGCRRNIYFRIQKDDEGNLGGIQIHSTPDY